MLGSTGSIGTSTLDVVARHAQQYRVIALTAHRQDDVLFEQCVRFKPMYAVLVNAEAADRLAKRIAFAGLEIKVLSGADALEQ
ncbi:MAG TPA: 1-deoxy-D-xylulose-5-phosphate reductoisomerase, partial [Pseudomonadales bacterium]